MQPDQSNLIGVIYLPLYIPVSKKMNFAVNLNQYRNAHFHVLNKAKVVFGQMIHNQIKNLPEFERIEIEYILFPGSARIMDINNICCIADKFFCDTLVEEGKLPDDNFNHLVKTTMSYGKIDSKNPRVEAHITGTRKKEQPMQIVLTQNEIEEAIKLYVAQTISIASGQDFNIDLRAGRGPEGFTATLEVQTVPRTSHRTNEDMLRTALQIEGNTMDRIEIKALPEAALKAPERVPEPQATQIKDEPQKASEPAPDSVSETLPETDDDDLIEEVSPRQENLFKGFGSESAPAPTADMPKGPADPAPTPARSLFNFGG
jgi:hypothetical protein